MEVQKEVDKKGNGAEKAENAEKEEEDDGEEAADVPDQSPWPMPHHEDPRQRVVGWRAGISLTSKDVQEILRKERRARHEYKGLRKASAHSKARESSDPLAGLPPTWQAFWSTVPHLDPQSAYRQFRKEQQRQVKSHEQAQFTMASDGKDDEIDHVEDEARSLDEEVVRKKQVLAAKERLCIEWDKKLARVRVLDRDEGELSRRVVRKLESASYAYGILEGKIRSSDIYFHFLYEDSKIAHGKKVTSLQRSYALMGKQIDMLKGEVRMLLKSAADAPPSSEHLQTSEKRRSAESSEGKQATGEAAAIPPLPQQAALEAGASSSPLFQPTVA